MSHKIPITHKGQGTEEHPVPGQIFVDHTDDTTYIYFDGNFHKLINWNIKGIIKSDSEPNASDYNDYLLLEANSFTNDYRLKYSNGSEWKEIAPKVYENNLYLEYNHLIRPNLKGYTENLLDYGLITVDEDIPCDSTNTFKIILGNNITIGFSNVPSDVYSLTLFITQDATTAYTITWPANVKWKDGIEPDISTLGDFYVIVLFTFDGGTTWYGMLSGSAFS